MAGFAERKTKGERQDTTPWGDGGKFKKQTFRGVKIFYFCLFSLLFAKWFYTFRGKTLSLISVNISLLTRFYTPGGSKLRGWMGTTGATKKTF